MVKSFFTRKLPDRAESLIKRFLEDAPELMVRASGDGLQGREITARIDRLARERLVCLDRENRFLPDAWLVWMHPEDFENLGPLFRELKHDALTQLELVRKDLDARLKAPFSVHFERCRIDSAGSELLPGTCRIQASFTVDQVHTMMVRPGELQEEGVSFQTEALPVPAAHQIPMFEVCRLLQHQQPVPAEALAGLPVDSAPGLILRALALFCDGQFLAGVRILNTAQVLRESEHGHYLRAFTCLSMGDADRAAQWLGRVTAQRLNPMGALLGALLERRQGNAARQQALLNLARQDELLNALMDRHLPGLNTATSGTPATPVLALTDAQQGACHLLAALPLALRPSPPGHEAQLRSVPIKDGGLILRSEGDQLLLKGRALRVNNQTVPRQGLRLAHGDRIQFGALRLSYAKQIFTGQWNHAASRRRHPMPCHVLRVDGHEETWYLNEDNTFTLGRGQELGNDLSFPNKKQISGQGHAEIHCDNNRFYLCDLGSTNGSSRNGVRLGQQPETLTMGDQLRLGDQLLKIRTGGD